MKNLLLLFLFMGAGFGAYKYAKNKPIPQPKAEQVTVQGKLLRGVDIDKSYCPNGIYIVPDHILYPTLILKTASQEIYSNDKYVSNIVNVKGIYKKDAVMCEALICGCDESITVTSIEVK